MPPARSGLDAFSTENSLIDICPVSEASIFSDDDSFLDKSNIMDLEEFMSMHKNKVIKSEETTTPNGKLPTGDFLSNLLKNVHKNLGLIPAVNENTEPVSDVSSNEEEYDDDNPTLVDHKYIGSSGVGENNVKRPTELQQHNSRQNGRRRKARTYKYNPKPVQQKTNRNFVPDKMKDEEYWERRKRNNQAAKKSREDRRRKELEVLEKMSKLEKFNSELMVKVEMLEKRNEFLEKRFKKMDKFN